MSNRWICSSPAAENLFVDAESVLRYCRMSSATVGDVSFEVDWPTRVLIHDMDLLKVKICVEHNYPRNQVELKDGVVLLYSLMEGQEKEVIVEFYTRFEYLKGQSFIATSWDEFVARRMNGVSGMWGARVRGSGTGWTVRHSSVVGPLKEAFGKDFWSEMLQSLPGPVGTGYGGWVGGVGGRVKEEKDVGVGGSVGADDHDVGL